MSGAAEPPEMGSAPPKLSVCITTTIDRTSSNKIKKQRVQTPEASDPRKSGGHASPQDKPLPSLPVASMKFNSPVRRSLIDCAEKPLRRSVSSAVGGLSKQEDWPVIRPSQGKVMPSLGESVIERMKNLNLNDRYDGTNADQIANETFSHGNESKGKGRAIEPFSPVLTGTRLPISSAQYSNPRDSMLASLSHHVHGPTVRQTKTSAMRLKNSIDKRNLSPDEKAQAAIQHDRPQPPVVTTLRDEHLGAPLRPDSRSRCGVTAKGSPYAIPSRSNSIKSKPSKDENRVLVVDSPLTRHPQTYLGSMPTVKTSPHSISHHQRGSSIPVPSRTLRQPYGRFSDSSLTHQNYRSALEADEYDRKKYSPESSPVESGYAADVPGSSASVQAMAVHELSAVTSNDQLNLREMLSLPFPQVVEKSFFDSDTSEDSVRGYDADGGFRIHRVRNAPKGGPTLRVRDSASELLLGKDDAEADYNVSDVKLRRKETQKNLRQGDGIRNSLRRTSGIVQRSLSLAKSATERSLSFGKFEDDDATQKLIEESVTDGHNIVGADDGQGSSQPVPSSVYYDQESFGEPSSKLMAQSVADQLRQALALSKVCSTPGLPQEGWRTKDFTDFMISAGSDSTTFQESSPSAPGPRSIKYPRTRAQNIPESANMIMRENFDKDAAPLRIGDEQRTQHSYGTTGLPHVRITGPDASTSPATDYPVRTSSRKHRPPPLFVSGKTNAKLGNRYPAEASKVQAEDVGRLRQPRNVKTFSQSISPGSGIRAPRGLRHSPSKKVLAHVRGLFKKRSAESHVGKPPGLGLRKTPSLRVLGIGPPSSVRRKAVPHTARFPNSLLDPSSALHEHSDNDSTDLPTNANPFADPTDPVTPFTAGIKASPASSGPSSSLPTLKSPAASRPTSSTIGVKSPPGSSGSLSLQGLRSSPPLAAAPTIAPELQSAIQLSHALLLLAGTESVFERKERLIQLSQNMVRICHIATDAKQAAEQAKIESLKAEMAWMKCEQAVVKSEEHARELLMMLSR